MYLDVRGDDGIDATIRFMPEGDTGWEGVFLRRRWARTVQLRLHENDSRVPWKLWTVVRMRYLQPSKPLGYHMRAWHIDWGYGETPIVDRAPNVGRYRI